MKKSVIYIYLLLLFSGCTLRPWGVLSQDKMVDILLDVHMVEAAIKTIDPNIKRIEKQEYYNRVFVNHGTTKEQFDKSIDWYSRKPDLLAIIYDEVKSEAEQLQERVEAYEFHPGEKPTRADSIEEFDLWHWERDRLLVLNEDSLIAIDSLHFSIKDTTYFYKTELLRLYLKMRVYAPDSVSFVTRMVCHYSDSVIDTLQYITRADSVCRRYHFTQVVPYFRNIDSLFIELIDSARTIERVQIDSVQLNRVYDKYTYPIDSDLRRTIRSANDSIQKEKERKLEEKRKKEEKEKNKKKKDKKLVSKLEAYN